MNKVSEVASAEIIESTEVTDASGTKSSDLGTTFLLNGNGIEIMSNRNCEEITVTPVPVVPQDHKCEPSEDVKVIEESETASLLHHDDIETNHNHEAMNMTPVPVVPLGEAIEPSKDTDMLKSAAVSLHLDEIEINCNPEAIRKSPVQVAVEEIIEPSEIKDILRDDVSVSSLLTVLDKNTVEIHHQLGATDIIAVPMVAIDEEIEPELFVSTVDDSIDIEIDLDQQYSKLSGDDLPEILLPSCAVEGKGEEDEELKSDVVLDKRNRRILSAPVNLFAAALKGASGMSRRERSRKVPLSKLTENELGRNSVIFNDDLNQRDCDKSSEMDNYPCPDSNTDAMNVQIVSNRNVNDDSPQPVKSIFVDTKSRNTLLSQPATVVIEDDDSNCEETLDDLGSDLLAVRLIDSHYDTASIQSNNSKDSGNNQNRNDIDIKDNFMQPKGRGAFSKNISNGNFHSDKEIRFENSRNANKNSRSCNSNNGRDDGIFVSTQSNMSQNTRIKKNFDSPQPSSNYHTRPQDRNKRPDIDNLRRDHDSKIVRPPNNSTAPHRISKDVSDNIIQSDHKRSEHNISSNKDDVNRMKKNVIDYGDFPNQISIQNNSISRSSNDSSSGNNFNAKNNEDFHKKLSNINKDIPFNYDRGNNGLKNDQKHKNDTTYGNKYGINNSRQITGDSNTFKTKNPTHKKEYTSGPPKYQSKTDVSIQEKLKIHLSQSNNVTKNHNDSNDYHTTKNDNVASRNNGDHVMSKNDHDKPSDSHGIIENNSNHSSNNGKAGKNDSDSGISNSNIINHNTYDDNNRNRNDNAYSKTKATESHLNDSRSYSNESNKILHNKNSTFEEIIKANMISKKKESFGVNDDFAHKKTSIELTLKSAFSNKQSKSWADDNSDDD